MSKQVVAIVGAGFAGQLTAYQIVKHAHAPMEILLFDAHRGTGMGFAYSTNCPTHLLNVPAGKMGALPEEPEHFYRWLVREPQDWRLLDPSFEQLEVTNEAYLPRMLYGAYLRAIRADMLREALEKKISLVWIAEDVVDMNIIGGRSEVVTTSGVKQMADAVVLALSSPWTKRIAHEASPAYLDVPWPLMTDMAAAKRLLGALGGDGTVGIIGSGLTMLDMLATLQYCGYAGKVTVMSGKNLLPQPHGISRGGSLTLGGVDDFPETALELYKVVRGLCKKSEWRSVVDALRPSTKALWQRMPLKEKRIFLRRLFGLWNSHRHRAPGEALALVDAFRDQGRLEIVEAMVSRVKPAAASKVRVFMTEVKTGKEVERVFDLAINCSGPNYEIRKHTSLLIQKLLEKRYIVADELGLGVLTRAGGPYAIGSLLFGTNFETTAVPEIREQCRQVAAQIIKQTL